MFIYPFLDIHCLDITYISFSDIFAFSTFSLSFSKIIILSFGEFIGEVQVTAL